ncbi:MULTISPECIES: RHS repeat-associated core domain-containing protein [Pseudomonas]|uniref:RHS Repeat protein n=4 Tax=Pseudomonas putida group TaxID=136845 RepID=A0A1B2F5F8_PSEPU|nr:MULTISPECIES: RHS repeat-associated core domain-containing protein [Pseudomonas]ANY87539.1 RHS Repeat protein [Pseudomonas putida]
MSTSLFSQTPMVTVRDNRNLAVREIAFHRHPDTPQVTDTRITYHRHDARGFLAQSTDPRLREAGLANFTYLTSLSGEVLRTQSADAGTSLALSDVAGRPCLTLHNLSPDKDDPPVTCTWQYEDASLPGRPLSVTQQLAGAPARIVERLVWAAPTPQAQAQNLAGQCIRHYDTAGLERTNSIALTGVSQSVTRQLLKNADNPDTLVDWQGEDDAGLEPDAHTTLTTADATGAVLSTQDAAGHKQRLRYDVAGQLAGSWLTLKGGTEQVIVKALSYSAAGQKLREEHGNGLVTTYTYEPKTQRLAAIKTERQGSGAKVLQDLRYAYDPVGNVVSVRNDAEATRFWRNQKVVPENTYAYDSLYQLVSATGREMADPGTYTQYTRTYGYDSAGNLTRIRHSAPASGNSYTTDITVSERSNRAVLSTLAKDPTEVETLFNASGQQRLLLPGQSLAWTPRGELHQVFPVKREGGLSDHESYRYDRDSQRVLKSGVQQASGSVQTQRVLYLPGLEQRRTATGDKVTEDLQVITVGEAGRAQVRVLHWAFGKPTDLTNDQLRYSYDNLLGSSALEVDGVGNLISQEEFYPFGGTAVWTHRNAVEASYKTVRYSGKERDATGLYYYGYRYYQSWAGRWLSTDPAGTVDGLNLYRMVKNNPVTWRDGDGREQAVGPLAPDGTPLAKLFESGDIVYGLDAPRKKAVAALEGVGVKRKEAKASPTGMLRLFKKKKERSHIVIQNDITDAVWDPGNPTQYAQDKDIKNHLHDFKRGISFREFLKSHAAYNVKELEGARQLKENPSLVMKLGPELWKKTSKAGLAFQLLDQKKTVHFVVDIIEDTLAGVASKTKGPGTSITSSELRWLYRHRALPEVQANLIFYREGKKISQDEIFGKPEWENYKPKNSTRRAGP